MVRYSKCFSPLHASRTEFWILFLSLPFGATCPAHLIFNDNRSDLAVQEGLDSVDLRWGYRMMSHRSPSKSSSICYTAPCSTNLRMQKLLVTIFGSGMLFGRLYGPLCAGEEYRSKQNVKTQFSHNPSRPLAST